MSIKRKTGRGRTPTKMSPRKLEALKRYLKDNLGHSQSRSSAKFNVTQQYVSKILKTKTAMKYQRRATAPLVTEAQKKRQQTPCERLRKELL